LNCLKHKQFFDKYNLTSKYVRIIRRIIKIEIIIITNIVFVKNIFINDLSLSIGQSEVAAQTYHSSILLMNKYYPV
jgi:hypothetical protein